MVLNPCLIKIEFCASIIKNAYETFTTRQSTYRIDFFNTFLTDKYIIYTDGKMLSTQF